MWFGVAGSPKKAIIEIIYVTENLGNANHSVFEMACYFHVSSTLAWVPVSFLKMARHSLCHMACQGHYLYKQNQNSTSSGRRSPNFEAQSTSERRVCTLHWNWNFDFAGTSICHPASRRTIKKWKQKNEQTPLCCSFQWLCECELIHHCPKKTDKQLLFFLKLFWFLLSVRLLYLSSLNVIPAQTKQNRS